MNNLPRAIELTEEIRASLEAEVAVAREERVLIRRMDSEGLMARATKRAAFNTRTAALMVSLGQTLAAAAEELGLTEVTMDGLQSQAPVEGGKMASLLAEVRALAAKLSQLDALNRMLSQRALSYVRAHLAVLSPKPAAYDRRGGGAKTDRTSTFVRVA
jgi:hypothetical protein